MWHHYLSWQNLNKCLITKEMLALDITAAYTMEQARAAHVVVIQRAQAAVIATMEP